MRTLNWRASFKLIGWLPAAAGALAVTAFTLLNATVWRDNPPGNEVAFVAAARVVETFVPLAVGMHAAFLLSPEDEVSLELLLVCPRLLFWLLLERLAVLLAMHGLVAAIGSVVALTVGPAESLGLATVRWLAPSLLLAGVALMISLLSRKGLLSALIVLLLWGGLLLGGDAVMGQLSFFRPLHLFLQPDAVGAADYARNRISLALLGVAAIGIATVAADDEEQLLGIGRPGNPWKQAFVDRWNLLWLPLAAGLMLLSSGNQPLAWAAWLGPVFLLRFIRRQPAGSAGPFVAFLVAALVVYWRWGDMLLPSMSLGVLVFGIYYGVYAVLPYLLDVYLTRNTSPVTLSPFYQTLVFPLAWVTLEYLHISLSPLALHSALAYTQFGVWPLMQVASVTGIYGVSFMVAWFAAVVNWAWEREFSWWPIRRGVLIYAGVLAAVLFFGVWRLNGVRPESDTVRVALFSLDDTNAESYLARARQAAQAGAQLIGWPEGAVVLPAADEPTFVQQAGALAKEHGIYWGAAVAVIPPDFPRSLMENKVIWFDPAGQAAAQYLKSIPVPGVELAVAGDGQLPALDTPFGQLSSAICYDLDFPWLIRQAGRSGVDLLVAPSADVETGAVIHAREAVFRAVENGFALLRPAANGLWLAANHRGRLLASEDSFTAGERQLVVDVPIPGVTTVYGRVGDWFAWLAMVGLGILGWHKLKGKEQG